jgi:hypothetical protein
MSFHKLTRTPIKEIVPVEGGEYVYKVIEEPKEGKE